MIFDELNTKMDEILSIHKALPNWIPLTKEYANECGYQTLNGLRKWCYNNLSPDDFQKRGNHWFIHISASHLIKRRMV